METLLRTITLFFKNATGQNRSTKQQTMHAVHSILLRPTVLSDLEVLFVFQLDPEANYLAAFTSKDAADKQSYLAKYTALLNNPTVNMQTVLVNGIIAESISKFEMEDDAEITYWFDKKWWGKGIASAALQQFLLVENTRPIYGRVAFDNIGSQKVLEAAGFRKTGIDRGFAYARQIEIEEAIYKLDP